MLMGLLVQGYVTMSTHFRFNCETYEGVLRHAQKALEDSG